MLLSRRAHFLAGNLHIIGYGWVSISDEQTEGALSGLGISATDSDGFTYGGGVDFFVTDNLFIRGDVAMLDFS